MILVRLYSRPLINATLEDAFYRYAYESLQAIYLVPVIAKERGLHLSVTVTLCKTGRDYFPRTWGKRIWGDPCRTNPKSHGPSRPKFPGRSDACLIQIRIQASRLLGVLAERVSKATVGCRCLVGCLGHVPFHPVVGALEDLLVTISLIFFPFSFSIFFGNMGPRWSNPC